MNFLPSSGPKGPLTLVLVLPLILLLTQTPQEVQTARILAVEFFGSKSHVITYLSLLEELSRRGHSVTILGPGAGLSKEKGIKEIFTFDFNALWTEHNISFFEIKESGEELNPFTMITEVYPKYCRELYSRPDIKELMTQEFDLILAQPIFNECALGLVHRVMTYRGRKVPLVLFSIVSAPNFLVDQVGGHHPSSFVPNTFLGFRDEMSFYERVVNVGTNLLFKFIMNFNYLPVMEGIYREKLGDDVPSSSEILGSASIVLSNSHFSLVGLKPNLQNVIDVGGIHSREAQKLPKELEDFIGKSGDDGFILFSFGTAFRGDQMPEEKRNIFLNVFAKLKQQIVWKYEVNDDDPEGLESVKKFPKNVYLGKWLPQQDLLGHEKVKLFITHCGMGGTEEAIYHGVPLLGIPFFGDQPMNAKEAENHGYLYKMEWNQLTEKGLMNGIKEVLTNTKYRNNVKRLSKVFKDQIDNPLDRGVWWMEYVLRHNGAPQLQSPARKLNYFQYHSLDVFGFCLVISIAFIWIVVKILRYLGGKLFNSLYKSNVKSVEKKIN